MARNREAFQRSPEDILGDVGGSPFSFFGNISPLIGKLLIGVAAIALAAAGVYAVSHWSFDMLTDTDYQLTGKGVDRLEQGAAVVVSNQQVGVVEGLDLIDGRQVARLRIDRQYAEQIRQGSEFKVVSLNRYLPGNVGVVVTAPADSLAMKLPPGTMIETSNDVLPPEIPLGFYVVVVGALVLLAFTIAMASWLRSWMVVLVAAAIAGAVWLYLNNTIHLPFDLV